MASVPTLDLVVVEIREMVRASMTSDRPRDGRCKPHYTARQRWLVEALHTAGAQAKFVLRRWAFATLAKMKARERGTNPGAAWAWEWPSLHHWCRAASASGGLAVARSWAHVWMGVFRGARVRARLTGLHN